LVQAAASGNKKFFLGTDSAPHAQHTKENACGCAGIYTAHAAIADYYGLPRNTQQITLHKEAWQVPAAVAFGKDRLVPLRAGESIAWKMGR